MKLKPEKIQAATGFELALREMSNVVEYTGPRYFTTPGESHIRTRRVRTRYVSESVVLLTLMTRRVRTSRGLDTSSASYHGVSGL